MQEFVTDIAITFANKSGEGRLAQISSPQKAGEKPALEIYWSLQLFFHIGIEEDGAEG